MLTMMGRPVAIGCRPVDQKALGMGARSRQFLSQSMLGLCHIVISNRATCMMRLATNDNLSIAPLACELLHCLGDIPIKSDA
jgi:hypothetical protein